MGEPTFGPVRGSFRALATTIVPDAARLDDPAWAELEALIEGGLSSRPDAVKRQLRLFVRILGLLSILRFGRTLPALDAESRTAFLRSIESAPVLLLRRGFWGLRTLVFMGYYGREEARRAIGYRAHRDGWGARW